MTVVESGPRSVVLLFSYSELLLVALVDVSAVERFPAENLDLSTGSDMFAMALVVLSLASAARLKTRFPRSELADKVDILCLCTALGRIDSFVLRCCLAGDSFGEDGFVRSRLTDFESRRVDCTMRSEVAGTVDK
jgi:hypothetical protein